MPGISENITITDNVTPVLRRMAGAAGDVAGEFNAATSSARRMAGATASVSSAGLSSLRQTASTTSPVMIRVASAARQVDTAAEAIDGRGLDDLRQSAERTTGVLGRLRDGFGSSIGQFAIGNIAASGLMMAADAMQRIVQGTVSASDRYAEMQARLRLITNSAAEAAQMNDLIYASAQRSRGSYDAMLESVGKIAMTAKSAFPDPRQVVPFMEGIQKLFVIGGTGVQQQADALLQLTQALGSGRLQGDEFRSIAEAAPLIESMIAKEMGVAQGNLKQLGSEGKITSDIIKAAILNNIDEINRQFEETPQTWGSISQRISNAGLRGMAPFLNALNSGANGDAMRGLTVMAETALPAIGTGLAVIAYGVNGIIDGAWNAGAAIVSGIGGGISMLAPLWAPVAGAALAAAAAIGVHNAAVVVAGTVSTILAQRTSAVAAAQRMLNMVMSANPLMLVIGLIGAVIGSYTAWNIATYGLRNTFVSAMSSIGGAAQWMANMVISAINVVIRGINAAGRAYNSSFLARFTGKVGTIDEIQEVSGWDTGMAAWAGNAADSLSNMMSMPAMSLGAGETYAGSDALNSIADNTGQTADAASRVADSVDALDADLQYLRGVAEQQIISQQTNQTIHVELGGMYNTVNNAADIDGIEDRLSRSIIEAMQAGAEGVHV